MASKLAEVAVSIQSPPPVDSPTQSLAAPLLIEDQGKPLNGDAMALRDSGVDPPSKEPNGTTTHVMDSPERPQTVDQSQLEANTTNSESKVENAATEKTWATDKPIDLYCRKNGQPHAVLTEFDIWKCPECRQSLHRPDFKKKPSVANTDGNTSKDAQPSKETSTDFSYSVRYLDEGEYPIMTEPREGPFDLAEARKGVPLNTQAVFTVLTEVITSIPADNTRRQWEVEDIKAEGILTNPKSLRRLVELVLPFILKTSSASSANLSRTTQPLILKAKPWSYGVPTISFGFTPTGLKTI